MKKKIIYLSIILVLVISVLTLSCIYKSKDNKYKKEYNTISKGMAIMIKEEGATDYVQSNSKDIPKGNYVLNEEKTHCENNGKVTNYNSASGTVSLNFIGSDKCYLYFDVITDTEKPVISNLVVNDTTITATLTDNESLSGYGISTSNSTEPTSWTTISGTTYNLSTTITTEGTYYLWVKDSAGNKAVSDVIDLETKGWKTILANNTVNSTTPNFSSAATTSEGLYKAEDDLGTSYYFRGAVNNNWVKFGKEGDKDIYWRIIRINGDGSIRMIYSGTTAPTSSTATVMTGTGTQINATEYIFNSSYNKAEYVGYMYTEGKQHENGTSSPIKATLENWYAGTTLKDNDLVADQIFCNDRSATTSSSGTPGEISGSMSSSTTYYYGAYIRLITNKSPQLTCPTESDKFTVNTSNGNGALTYPVGLITADEVAMAGGVYGTSNSSYYLYTNQYYWSGSPLIFSSSDPSAIEFGVNSSGSLYYNYVFNAHGARPVVSLSSKAKLSGSGTYNDVYTVN